ncbi:MAG TPA: PQQ-dependent dehydrogenase, methanol/ethanol family [Dongiaceae bacterium]|nr:PQQ-dependent dehydrogenase, methanol/ethanol family [Dongiaceae bacterium]
MTNFATRTAAAAAAAGLLWAAPAGAGPVTADDLLDAQANAAEWLTYGRDYRNQRFSPLDRITPDNVGGLRPVWALSTGGKLGGLEATPLIRDGVLYFSADYGRVFAVDARTGVAKWTYEPEYDEGLTAMLCCGPIHRGVALRDEFVYLTRLDAKLVALNRADGTVAWEQKIDEWTEGKTANHAPLAVGDRIFVGISGGEYGARGYVKAYDAKTGEPLWTTYTIPAPGEPGNETWPGEMWKTGGGPTWITGAYDAETDTLYWGTGNPGPWAGDMRPGDNLWSDSLLALDPATGKIKWGFQYTPNDSWDYDGANAPILVDVTIDGKPVKAAVQSNRNGFLYVLDRTNGKFIYAVPTVDGINWTTGLDPVTGRPAINEAKKPKSDGKRVEPIVPGLEGGTNWFPPAYNPELGYVFIATNQWAMGLTGWEKERVVYKPGDLYMGMDYQMYRVGDTIGRVKAFDVANKKWVWEVPSPLPLFAGLLATKSGLVFTGDQRGFFMALDAKTGKELWKFQTGSGINASPITYELDGKQYVAILSGLGGDPGFYYSAPKGGMLWVFSIDGALQDSPAYSQQVIDTMLPTFKP